MCIERNKCDTLWHDTADLLRVVITLAYVDTLGIIYTTYLVGNKAAWLKGWTPKDSTLHAVLLQMRRALIITKSENLMILHKKKHIPLRYLIQVLLCVLFLAVVSYTIKKSISCC